MADWLSSLLAGLGSGAESLGTSMSEREKRDAAAKQRAFELAMQQADKNAELGITDIAPRLPSEAALTKMSDTIGRIGALGKPQSMDMLSDQLGLRPAVGGQVQKFTTSSPDFSIGGLTPDMSDAASNYEVSRTGASTLGPRPTSPRFDNFTDQTVVPAATPPAAPLAAPPSAPSAASMAPAAGPRTVSALGAPTMPRTRLGSIPDVQSQLPAPSMTTGGLNEGESTVMQYDPLHPEAGLIRKRFNYQAGSDYAKKKAEENLPANMLARQNVESEIANRNATEKRTTAATKDLETKSRYVSSPTGFAADLAALRRDPKNADVLSRVLSMTSGTPNQEVYHRLVEDILIKKTDPQDKRQRITDETELRREYDRFQQAKTALLRDKANNKLYLPEDLKAAQDNLADQERTVNMLADRQDAYGGSPTVYRTNRTLKAAPASASPGAGTKLYTTKSGKTYKVP